MTTGKPLGTWTSRDRRWLWGSLIVGVMSLVALFPLALMLAFGIAADYHGHDWRSIIIPMVCIGELGVLMACGVTFVTMLVRRIKCHRASTATYSPPWKVN